MSKPKTPNRGLGRGLSSLMSDVSASIETKSPETGSDRTLPVDQIYPNPDQPRRTFDDQAMDDLTASISEKGIIQPLIVRKKASPNGLNFMMFRSLFVISMTSRS